MSGGVLNGDVKMLVSKLEALEQRIDDKTEALENLNKAQWKGHEERAKDLPVFIKTMFDNVKKGEVPIGAIIAGILTIISIAYAGIWGMGSFLGQQMELNEKRVTTEIEDMKSEQLRIRQWKDVTESTIPVLQTEIKSLKEMIIVKSADRFTGKQGQAVQKQIDRLEERLTFLTKQAMEFHGGGE